MILAIADILIILSLILFILGFLGIFIRFFRKKIRLRHYFIASVLCFSLALYLEWDSFVKGFKDGCNDYSSAYQETEQID
jgi:cell shape-determining protein MreC